MKKLSVNIDHVATIREARKTYEPNPVTAALMSEIAGAHGITLHLREDRRHINDRDLELMRQVVSTELNLEMAHTDEIIAIAKRVKPDLISLVPEKRQEVTTEGGLNVIPIIDNLINTVREFKALDINVNLFIDPDREQIEASAKTGAHSVELHTGSYANAKNYKLKQNELKRIATSARQAFDMGLEVHAGHGLNYINISPIAEIDEISEFAIGHSIVSRAVFVGIQQAVREMLRLINP